MIKRKKKLFKRQKIIVYGSVTCYGPRTSCQPKELTTGHVLSKYKFREATACRMDLEILESSDQVFQHRENSSCFGGNSMPLTSNSYEF